MSAGAPPAGGPGPGERGGDGTAPADGPGAGSDLGARLTHDTALYTIGSVIGLVLALINVIVLTRFLSPDEFGQLALLLLFASFLTIAYNLAILQGTFTWVFGSAGEDDVEDEETGKGAQDKRRALGTGLVVTVLITALGTIAVAALAPVIADLLLGDDSDSDLVMIAAASAAAGAIWRLSSNVLRMERRPYAFVALSAVRPLLVIAVVIPLVASGDGVEGAVAGTAIGGTAAVLVALLVTRRSFIPALRAADAREIARRGAVFVPIVVAFWIAQNVDLYALSRFASDEQVGLYRLAARIGAFVAYFSSALFMAWTPLVRTPAFKATQRSQGQDVLGGTLLSFYVIGGMLLLIALTVTADGLVRIAPPAYEDAAPLIPLLAGGFLAHGLLVAVYRVSQFPGKRTAYIGSAILSAVLFLALALVLIPWLGAEGAALSVIVGFLGGMLVMGWLSQRGPHPLQIDYRRIGITLTIAALCLVLARAVGDLAGDYQPAVEVGALVLYPVMLVLAGVLVREERRAVARMLRGAVPRRRASERDRAALERLDPDQRALLESAISGRLSPEQLAARTGGEPDRVSAQLTAALRVAAGGDRDGEHGDGSADSRVGAYLFSTGPIAERDALGTELMKADVDPGELHRLELTLAGLKRLPAEAWRSA